VTVEIKGKSYLRSFTDLIDIFSILT